MLATADSEVSISKDLGTDGASVLAGNSVYKLKAVSTIAWLVTGRRKDNFMLLKVVPIQSGDSCPFSSLSHFPCHLCLPLLPFSQYMYHKPLALFNTCPLSFSFTLFSSLSVPPSLFFHPFLTPLSVFFFLPSSIPPSFLLFWLVSGEQGIYVPACP